MAGPRRTLPVIGFVAGFLAVGVPFWSMPYAKANLPDGVVGVGLVVVAAAAMGSRAWALRSTLAATLFAGAAVPAAVLARVIVETAQDPTRHNLWPLELVLSAVPGMAVAVVGALAGRCWARARGAP